MKKFTMVGAILGMTIGSYIPLLWGAGLFSMTSVLLSGLFGIIGLWLGFRIGRGY